MKTTPHRLTLAPLGVIVIVTLLNGSLVRVQSTSAPSGAPAQGAGAGGRGGGLGNGAAPAAYGDYTGFTRLFDGQTLTGWNGESDVWSIDGETLHADTAWLARTVALLRSADQQLARWVTLNAQSSDCPARHVCPLHFRFDCAQWPRSRASQ